MKPIHLSTTEISDHGLPYVIAEIGVNHEGSMETAFRLIEEAKRGGAHAAKFQTYKADLIAMKQSPAYWDQSEEPADSQHELFLRYDSFSSNDYQQLADHCRKVGIDFMSTPFDLQAVEELDPIVDVFKIASADITNIPLLRRVGATGKPVILSTGASTVEEIDAALAVVSEAGATQIVLLHCILNYPTDEENANLAMIVHLRERYPEAWIGISDHTRPTPDNLALVVSYALGARVIEKHFTHDKSLPGNDHYHAMDMDDLARLITALERTRSLLGTATGKHPLPSEDLARRFARRGICATRNLPEGHVLTEVDLICLRPVTGIPANHWDEVLGRTLSRPVTGGDGITWADLIPG